MGLDKPLGWGNLFQKGDFTLHSGAKSDYKIDCDWLTDGDLETLAYLLSCRLRPFKSVEGIPNGGLRLALALKQYARPLLENAPDLIADDVYTTGTSFKPWTKQLANGEVIGAVIFSRTRNIPYYIYSLFNMKDI